MSEDLLNEVEVINSIYGDDTLRKTDTNNVYSLQISCFAFPLKLQFDADYPTSLPTLLGSDTAGIEISREESSHGVELFKNVLKDLFEPGQVCLYDVIEEVTSTWERRVQDVQSENDIIARDHEPQQQEAAVAATTAPKWTISDPVTELKSLFIAHACTVTSVADATSNVAHLLASSKKIASATHNIIAWRIRSSNDPNVQYQDCSDDGETAAGGRLLHLMQLMDLWNVMIVVTRWYGGHHLGPKRFSLINQVARDAFVKGGWVEDGEGKKKGKK